MYTARSGVVNPFNPVGREKNDLLIRLKFSQEHRDECIAVDIMDGALLQKYIGFFEEKDGFQLSTRRKSVAIMLQALPPMYLVFRRRSVELVAVLSIDSNTS